VLGFGRLGFLGDENGRGSVILLRRDNEGIYMLGGRDVAHAFGLKVPTEAKIELLADWKAENIFRITFLGDGNVGSDKLNVQQQVEEVQQVQAVNEVQHVEEVQQIGDGEVQQVEEAQQIGVGEVQQVEEVQQVGVEEVQQLQEVNEVQQVQVPDDFEITVTEAMCNLEKLQVMVLINY
jgi:hypothetical protein